LVRNHLVFGRALTGELDEIQLEGILLEARERLEALSAVPMDAILHVLERVGMAWADPNFAPRVLAQAELPGQLGFSAAMVALELDGLAMALSRPYLEGKLQAELGRVDAGDVWHRRNGTQGFAKALPRGVVLHVASGNVSTTGVLSLVEGLLARNVNLLKAASNAPLLPRLFLETMQACDPTGLISGSLAMLSWSGEGSNLHEIFCRESDAIVVWGGDEVLETYRRALGPHVRLVTYGPKVSAGFLDAQSLAPEKCEATAKACARDIALWDQNACSSPQVLYLEDAEPQEPSVARFTTALARALDALAIELPMGPLDLHERAEITKERELALADELMGQGKLSLPTGGGPEWTIVMERDPAFKLSPLFRTITLKPVAQLEDALAQLAPYRHYLQTVALAVHPARAGYFAGALARAGALRVTRVGETSGGFPGEPHDGVFGLNELVRWVALDSPESADAFDGTIFEDAAQVLAVARAKRNRLVATHLPRSPYYKAILVAHGQATDEDWLALPLLDRETLVAQTPPKGQGLLTETASGGHWLRSGGSTGAPKLSIYSFDDYEADMWRAARGAHAAGLRRGERVANLFYAGDLYGSFLSLNRALELIGCNAFSFTQVTPTPDVLACLRDFSIETVIGLSTKVQSVLGEALRDPERWAGLRIRHVLYAGEPFADQERQSLMTGLGVERITSIGYGGVDAGPMGFQCAHCVGNVHHVHSDHVYLEVLDPATWRPVAEGEPGEVVMTSLNRRLMPLLRYKVGDRARWVPGLCPCGLGSPRFELLGRSDDRVRLLQGDFYLGDVHAAAAAIAGLQGIPQVELSGPPHAERVVVRAELSIDQGDPGRLAALLRLELLARIPDWAGLEFAVEIVRAGQNAGVGRAGKTVRLLDLRQAGVGLHD
jgi:phenylacetate-CoA ligase